MRKTQFYLNVFSPTVPPPQAKRLTGKQERFLVKLIHKAGRAAFQSAKSALLIPAEITLLNLSKAQASAIIGYMVKNTIEPAKKTLAIEIQAGSKAPKRNGVYCG